MIILLLLHYDNTPIYIDVFFFMAPAPSSRSRSRPLPGNLRRALRSSGHPFKGISIEIGISIMINIMIYHDLSILTGIRFV